MIFRFYYYKLRYIISRYNAAFKTARPEYSRRAWIFKAAMLFVSALGMELSGLKIASLEEVASINHAALDPTYTYFAGVNGLFMGLALWRLLELYWWAKNRAGVGI